MASQLEAPAEVPNEVIDAPANEAPRESVSETLYPDDQPPADDGEQDNVDPANEEATEQTETQETEVTEPEIDVPVSWGKDAKEVFAKLAALGEEGKAIADTISKREVERERFVREKSREAARTRQTVEAEAANAVQDFVQTQKRHLEAFIPAAQEPDYRLLQSQDPQHRELYFQQEAAYKQATAERNYITQQLQELDQKSSAIAQQQLQAELAQQHEILEERLGSEWSDPSQRATLIETISPIAAELGYSEEVIAQANASDILALKKVNLIIAERDQLKVKAEKYDKLMQTKMEPVRAAKNPPPAARPGTTQANSGQKGTLATLYPDDMPRR